MVRRNPRTGHAALNLNGLWLAQQQATVVVRIVAACLYDPGSLQWRRATEPAVGRHWRFAPGDPASVWATDRLLHEFPLEPGLYWIRWSVKGEDAVPRGHPLEQQAMVVSGPVLCNDVAMAPPPAGQVATCVPFATRAEARFVPDPSRDCEY